MSKKKKEKLEVEDVVEIVEEEPKKSEVVTVMSTDELISKKEKRSLIRKEKASMNVKNMFSRIFSLIFTLVVVAWVVICLVDFFQVQGNNDPMFCLSKETIKLDKGTISKCNGAGYKVLRFNKIENCNVKIIFGPFWLEDKCPTLK